MGASRVAQGMTVYSKTMAGRMVIVDPFSGLTPNLKSFLKTVDGKTPTDRLLASWQTGPDALQLLQELESRGLIEVRAVRWSTSSAHSSCPSSFFESVAPASDLQKSAAELTAIKERMATFMLTYLPHHAVTMLKEIEEIDSYDRLTLTLAAYANVANEAGRDGLAHIKSLRAMLARELEGSEH